MNVNMYTHINIYIYIHISIYDPIGAGRHPDFFIHFPNIPSIPLPSPCSSPASRKGSCRTPPLCPLPASPQWPTPRPATLPAGLRHLRARGGGYPLVHVYKDHGNPMFHRHDQPVTNITLWYTKITMEKPSCGMGKLTNFLWP